MDGPAEHRFASPFKNRRKAPRLGSDCNNDSRSSGSGNPFHEHFLQIRHSPRLSKLFANLNRLEIARELFDIGILPNQNGRNKFARMNECVKSHS
jgi:hypothetical protein